MPETRQAENVPMCTRCREFPVRTPGSRNSWCSKCNVEVNREGRRAKVRVARARGFALGVEAARVLLVAEFTYLGETPVTANEVAKIIERRLERP